MAVKVHHFVGNTTSRRAKRSESCCQPSEGKILRGDADAALNPHYSVAVVSSRDAVHTICFVRAARRNIDNCRAPGAAGVRAASLSRRKLYLDARLLGVELRR